MEVDPRRRLNLAVAIIATACTLAWVGAALLTAERGLDVTDEGFYLLSYRWWDSNPRTFTGVQYLYGPLFEALGHNVAALRVCRLLTILLAHLVLARAAVAWIRARRRSEDPSWLSAYAAGSVIVACGGLAYGWLPLSPGYNDVSVLGATLLLAGALHLVAASDKGHPLPVTWALALGPVMVALVLAKSLSAVITIGFVAATATASILLLRGIGGLRFCGWLLTSCGISVAILHLAVKPVGDILGPVVEVTRLVGTGSNAPSGLLVLYSRSTAQVLLLSVLPVLAAGMVYVAARIHRSTGLVWLASMAPPVAVIVSAWLSGGIHAGSSGVLTYTSALVTVALCVAIATLVDRGESSAHILERHRRRAHAVMVVAIAALPVVQALGTGNALYIMAVNGLAMWAVLLVLALDGAAWSTPRFALTASATVVVTGLVAWIGVDGLVGEPYRTETYPESSSELWSASTGTLRLAAGSAAELKALRTALAAETDDPGRPMMAFDEMAGLVLVLDGRPVGEAWYSAIDHERTAAGIRATCDATGEPWRDGLPVLLFNRPVSEVEIAALADCGLSFDTDFRPLPISGGPPGVTVYVPTNE
jgi:hypothetical protein